MLREIIIVMANNDDDQSKRVEQIKRRYSVVKRILFKLMMLMEYLPRYISILYRQN